MWLWLPHRQLHRHLCAARCRRSGYLMSGPGTRDGQRGMPSCPASASLSPHAPPAPSIAGNAIRFRSSPVIELRAILPVQQRQTRSYCTAPAHIVISKRGAHRLSPIANHFARFYLPTPPPALRPPPPGHLLPSTRCGATAYTVCCMHTKCARRVGAGWRNWGGRDAFGLHTQHTELRVNGINRSGRTISSRARRLRFSWDFGRRIDATDQMKTIRFYGVLHTFDHVSERSNVLLVVIFRVFPVYFRNEMLLHLK